MVVPENAITSSYQVSEETLSWSRALFAAADELFAAEVVLPSEKITQILIDTYGASEEAAAFIVRGHMLPEMEKGKTRIGDLGYPLEETELTE